MNKLIPRLGTIENYFRFAGFYVIAFLAAFLLQSVFYKQFNHFKKAEFWGLFVFAILVFSLRSNANFYREIIIRNTDPGTMYFFLRCASNIFPAFLLFIPMVFLKLFYKNELPDYYGVRFKGYNVKPYLILLLMMVPLILWASFQTDFLNMYPVAGDAIENNNIQKNKVFYFAFFELCYGFDFIAIEMFFRGFMIYAFARLLGRGIILPMAAFYVFIHFGKPMGEAISSFFGGAIIGIIAYETRSIIGGIIVHLGIAWLMEFMAASIKYSGAEQL